ncbi:MAG: radical SAM protein [Magnetococcales bacterium]|nr:radical SAM protein [Magnetococcales bacterium]MBF0433839.1 radical SAM protein [Magnetococcales bacterium]
MSIISMAEQLTIKNIPGILRSALGNFISLMTQRPNKGSPFYILWITTYGCNRKCLHCDWVWSRTSEADLARELNDTEQLQLVEQMCATDAWGVTISGGEPLMLPKIREILRRLKQAGKRVNLCSNGVLLPRFAEELVAIKLDSLTVSMDSFRPEEHDHIRGVPGSFQKSMAGIAAVKKWRGNRKFPKLVIKAVISSKNFREMAQWVEYFHPYADTVEFQPIQNNLVHQIKAGEDSLMFRPEEEGEFRRVMDDLAARWSTFKSPYYQRMADFIFHPGELFDSGGFRCLFLSSFFLEISPYGAVGSCPGHYVLGNVRERTILDIWRDLKTCEYQKKLRSKNNKCLCWTYNTFSNLYLLPLYKHSPWIKDP